MKTLIIIDVQNDFTPGGALAVPGGHEIVEVINELQKKFELVIATQDWHPKNHSSFAANHKGKSQFETIKWKEKDQILWPIHCVQETFGAEFHPELETERIESIFRKGTNPEIDSYSGFFDNNHLKSTGLTGYLREKGASNLYFCGLAGEYCVYFSAIDAIDEGFKVTLIEDATRALDEEQYKMAKKDIISRGGRILKSDDILKNSSEELQ